MPINLPPNIGADKMEQMKNIRVINVGPSQTPINFMDGLALLLIGLKLTDHLDNWTWIEVLAPLWAPFMFMWLVRLVVASFFTDDEEEE
jgi:hypothetical protein